MKTFTLPTDTGATAFDACLAEIVGASGYVRRGREFDVTVTLTPVQETNLQHIVAAFNPETAAILSRPSTQSQDTGPIYRETRINVYDSADPRGKFASDRNRPRSIFDPDFLKWRIF